MFNLPFFKKEYKTHPVVLLILDGFGLAPASSGNAITLAKTPNYTRLLNSYPHTQLIASGESVGLPANEEGNTEVGHLTMGAGRVILQDLKRINLSIEKGTFFDNRSFLQAAANVKEKSSSLHILGLVSSGNVHSSLEHLYALLQFCKKEDINRVYLHLFTDGRDAPPKVGIDIIDKLEEHLKILKVGRIASVTGRYYAMDRDRRWDRTEKTYKALVLGRGNRTLSAHQAVQNAYDENQTDEFIEPTVITEGSEPASLIKDGDSVIFFNYRIDRPRQLSMAFTIADFERLKSFAFGYDPETSKVEGEVKFSTTFEREKILKDLFFVTMTEYHKNLPVSAVAFPPEVVEKPLGQILSDAGLKQLHMAESEKERFVKYYFNGAREEPFSGEDDLIVASPKVPTYDKKPEMSLPKLVSEFKKQIRKDIYKFIVINFANPDMVAHSGNLQATIKAIEIVDKYLEELVEAVLEASGSIFITADHGNAEELLNFPTATFFYTSAKGTVNTDHSNNPVPFVAVAKNFRTTPMSLVNGALEDVAPTILNFMGIAKPDVMAGKNLLNGDKTVNSQQ